MGSNKGFSIVEVVISMVIIAMMAVFVATFFSFHNKMVSEAKKVTDNVFEIQNDIEQAQQDLVSHIKDGSAGGYATRTYSVFGKNVEVKLVASQLLNPDSSVALSLDTGVSSNYAAENPEPIRPKLTSVDVTAGSSNKVIYFPTVSDTAQAIYVKDPSTITSWYKNLYQWYASPSRIHGIPLANFTCNNSVYPKFPWDLDIMHLQDQKTMPGTDIVYPVGESAPQILDYMGRFLACAVTPGSYEGYMGNTYVDMIYVSALPKLTQGVYRLLIDPSLIEFTLPANFSGTTATTNTITSEKPLSAITSTLSAGSNVTVTLEGANISNNGIEGQEYYSRYISFGSVQMQVNNLNVSSGDVAIYAIARSTADTNDVVMQYKYGTTTTNILSIGSVAGQSIYPAFTDGQPAWYLVSGNYTLVSSDSTRLKIGSPTLDLAELIIVSNPSADDDTAIKNYLQAKYGIV